MKKLKIVFFDNKEEVVEVLDEFDLEKDWMPIVTGEKHGPNGNLLDGTVIGGMYVGRLNVKLIKPFEYEEENQLSEGDD